MNKTVLHTWTVSESIGSDHDMDIERLLLPVVVLCFVGFEWAYFNKNWRCKVMSPNPQYRSKGFPLISAETFL